MFDDCNNNYYITAQRISQSVIFPTLLSDNQIEEVEMGTAHTTHGGGLRYVYKILVEKSKEKETTQKTLPYNDE
jgi:hypothetical protein